MSLAKALYGARGRGLRRSRSLEDRIGGIQLDTLSVEQIISRLSRLPDAVGRKVIAESARYAMSPVLKSARRKVVRRSGALAKSLVEKVYRKAGRVYAVVKPDEKARDSKTGEVPFRIAHLVEFGTEPHEIHLSRPVLLRLWASGGQEASGYFAERWVSGTMSHPGAAPKPFLRPALLEQEQVVISRYRERVAKGVDREVAKLAGGR